MVQKTLDQLLISLPEVKAGKGIWQNPFHEFDVYDHSLDFVKHIKDLTDDLNLIVAGYLHDIGKPVCKIPTYKDGVLQEKEPGKPYHRFKNHEHVGANMVREMNSNIFLQYGLDKIKIADLVIYLFDITELTVEEVKGDVNQLELHVPHLLIANKIDKDGVESIIKKDFSEAFDNLVFISSKFQQNISALKVNLLKTLDIEKYQGDLSIVTNTRHYTILSEILRSIEEVNQGIDNQLTKDFITIDIRKIIQLMGEITGEITNDEILGNIFGRFCIGK